MIVCYTIHSNDSVALKGYKVDTMNVLTVVVLKGKDLTKPIRNRDAKTIALMLTKSGMAKENEITFKFPK